MKKVKSIVSVLITAVILLSSVTTAFAASSNDYQNNPRFHKISYSEANAKYNNGDTFIFYYYRDACSNSQSIGTTVLTKWMNSYSLDIYGQDCDAYPWRPSWANLPDTFILPAVCFVKNGTVKTYSATDGYQQLKDSISADVLTTFNITDVSYPGTVDPYEVNKYSYPVKYHQTEARSILPLVNDLRTDKNAWCYDSSNNVVWISGLSALTYDYDLEKSAMQRAAELVVMYSHDRPNGDDCFSAYTGYFNAGAENIAYGYRTYAEVEEAFEEANVFYSGQGHRRNILSEDVTAVAFACAEYKGVKCWVQEFRRPAGSTVKTTAEDGEVKVTVEIINSNIKSSKVAASPSAVSMTFGTTAALPVVNNTVSTPDTPRSIGSVATEVACNWSSSNTKIFTVSNGNIVAKGVGKADLTTTVNGASITIPVTVTGVSLSGAEVTLSSDRCLFNGSSATPAVSSVKLNGKTLTSNDYTVSYSSNTAVGTGCVTVTGKGNYYGSAEKNFEIYCNHSSTKKIPAVAATCTKTGLSEGTSCTICGAILVEQTVVPTKAHTPKKPEIQNVTASTCSKKGEYDEVIYCSVCGTEMSREHKYSEKTAHTPAAPVNENIIPGTCIKEGTYEKTVYCSVCGEEISRVLEYSGKGEHVSAAPVCENLIAATCTEDGSCEKVIYCATCHKELSRTYETLTATGHAFLHYVSNNDARIGQDGTETAKCEYCDETNTRTAVGSAYGKESLAIRNMSKYNGGTVDYKSTLTFHADTENCTDIEWYVNGRKAPSNSDGSCTVTKAQSDIEVYFTAKNLDGETKQSETEKITVKHGFFDKLIAFFRGLFGLLPVIDQ